MICVEGNKLDKRNNEKYCLNNGYIVFLILFIIMCYCKSKIFLIVLNFFFFFLATYDRNYNNPFSPVSFFTFMKKFDIENPCFSENEKACFTN